MAKWVASSDFLNSRSAPSTALVSRVSEPDCSSPFYQSSSMVGLAYPLSPALPEEQSWTDTTRHKFFYNFFSFPGMHDLLFFFFLPGMPNGGMGGRHAANTQIFFRNSRFSSFWRHERRHKLWSAVFTVLRLTPPVKMSSKTLFTTFKYTPETPQNRPG